jgi:hypothetical protein
MKNFKRIFSIILLSGIIIGNSFAYSQSLRNRYLIGLRAGLSIPSLKGGNTPLSEGYTSRSGLGFGLFVADKFTNSFAVQVELTYVNEGGVRNGMQPITDPAVPQDLILYANFKNEAIFNYVEIPLLAKYCTSLLENLHFYVGAGPYMGILVEAKTKTSGISRIYWDKEGKVPIIVNGEPLPPQNFDNVRDIRSDIKKTNFGLMGSIGLSTRFLGNIISLDARGAYGLTKIQKDPKNGENNVGYFLITLAYAIEL